MVEIHHWSCLFGTRGGRRSSKLNVDWCSGSLHAEQRDRFKVVDGFKVVTCCEVQYVRTPGEESGGRQRKFCEWSQSLKKKRDLHDFCLPVQYWCRFWVRDWALFVHPNLSSTNWDNFNSKSFSAQAADMLTDPQKFERKWRTLCLNSKPKITQYRVDSFDHRWWTDA
jgi:hypothetical protein